MKKIIFFGDSLTAGYGLSAPDQESMPALIAKKIAQEGMEYEVINAGWSGDTTRAARSRIGRHLQGDLALFVFELGANDFLRGYPPKEIRENMQYMIDQVRRQFPDLPILLLGMALPDWIAPQYGFRYADIFTTLSQQNELPLVPAFLAGVSGNSALNMLDGVHPLAAGYVVAANNIWPKISEILHRL